ncbi:MAG TPA: LysE family transporter [Stellaceae bacterium]|nr:LysE family transporter [Stellaceae bacterium]
MLILTLIKGIVVGIVIALPLGPVGVLCVRRTMFEGALFGLASGLGAALADTVFGIIAGFGLTAVRDVILDFQNWLGVGGGVFLVAAGARALTLRNVAPPEPLAGERLVGAFASTFAVTVTNPIAILGFTAIIAKVGLNHDATFGTIAVLIAGVFAGSALWWLGLTAGIVSLKRRAKEFHLATMNAISGAILGLSGIGLLVTAGLGLAGVRL